MNKYNRLKYEKKVFEKNKKLTLLIKFNIILALVVIFYWINKSQKVVFYL